MKFGLFYELSVPRPWTRETERTVYNNCARAGEAGRRAGLRPGVGGGAPLPRGVLALSRARAVPHRLRHGDQAHPRRPRHRGLRAEFNHPIKIAERTAMLDIFSGGRLRGRHRALGHLDRARRLPRQSRHDQEELGRVRAVPAEDVDAGDASPTRASSGRCRRATILPKVYQRPHPPMWVAVTSPGTELDAADRGIGALGLTFGLQGAGEAHRGVPPAHPVCKPVGAFVNDQVATANFLYCHEDEKTAYRWARSTATRSTIWRPSSSSTREVFSSPSYQSLGLLPALRRQATGPEASEQPGEGMAYRRPRRIIRAAQAVGSPQAWTA